MSKDFDKMIDDLTNQFKKELKQLKEEGFDEDYIRWLKEELRERFLVEMNKKEEEKILNEVREELEKDYGQDLVENLLFKVDLIQRLVYQILVSEDL
ncbi:MAG: hypothetical protein PWP27_1820 [Clostridiales bacterium]|jgi:hypothetical protein|nr:hypothetical protein [Clostridiales bacterium]MDK2934010.1 hypothetical protein [Clostridiales bacterium]